MVTTSDNLFINQCLPWTALIFKHPVILKSFLLKKLLLIFINNGHLKVHLILETLGYHPLRRVV